MSDEAICHREHQKPLESRAVRRCLLLASVWGAYVVYAIIALIFGLPIFPGAVFEGWPRAGMLALCVASLALVTYGLTQLRSATIQVGERGIRVEEGRRKIVISIGDIRAAEVCSNSPITAKRISRGPRLWGVYSKKAVHLVLKGGGELFIYSQRAQQFANAIAERMKALQENNDRHGTP